MRIQDQVGKCEKSIKKTKEDAQNQLNIEKTKLDDRIAVVDASV